MLNQLFKKQNEVENLLFNYIDQFRETRRFFQKAMEAHCSNENEDTIAFLSGEVHRHEAKADDILAQLANLMFGRALLPDVRNRIMQLVYNLDRIPELFKLALSTLRVQRLKIPPLISGDLLILVSGVCTCCDLVADQFLAYLKEENTVQDLLNSIRQEETHCDYQESFALQRIFDDPDINPFVQLQLKELTRIIGQIANVAEDISKGVSIVHISRSF